MNKNFFWISLLLLALILNACASSTRTPASASSGNRATVELPTQTKLILGTIKLEETEYTVNAEQAAELLPMFYVLKELNDSDTAAQEEIDGLSAQIQETLTDEQRQAIEGMSLSMQGMLSITQGNSGRSNTTDASSTASTNRGAAGGPPDIGSMPGGAPSARNESASDTVPVMDTSTPSALFDAVIELLQKKIQ